MSSGQTANMYSNK